MYSFRENCHFDFNIILKQRFAHIQNHTEMFVKKIHFDTDESD